ncbi:class I SAM-dependent methyltransferase [Erythrobacter insulae]|uniref:Class I SAM-dependent methyltransferase n=1 Tax=Erythrobacter insulae TaxID=2584124 RepID=A0A547PBZ9_9SPHN|nr:class I SAM-dependent methyltransferase [Erythrobacter insulae]TRD11659.1 class I SAM-dependent methyltransferase [Erythrobacter insulae]
MALPKSVHADRFVDQTQCLFCGSTELSAFIDGVQDWYFRASDKTFAFSRCDECASLVLDKRPDGDAIAQAYAGYYTHDTSIQPIRHSGLLQKLWGRARNGYINARFSCSPSLVDRVGAHLISAFPVRRERLEMEYRRLPETRSAVLDYGCGNGDFLAKARSLGHEVMGVDFDPEAVDLVRSRGLPACLVDAIEDKAFSRSFDHITANHVIEHVSDPRALIANFAKWLKPGGSIFMELPNARARGIAEHGNFWRGFEAPRHFALPTFDALKTALVNAGFANVSRIVRKDVRKSMDQIALSMIAEVGSQSKNLPVDLSLDEEEFITITAVSGD